MVTIIIFSIIGIFLQLKSVYSIGFLDDAIDWIFNGIFGAVLGGFLGFIFAVALPAKTFHKESILDLITLKDNSGHSGDFILGTGTIKNEMVYVFYYEENGYYKMSQARYNDVRIKIKEGKPRIIVTQVKEVENSFINLFAIDLNIDKKTYVFEIPDGSIKNVQNLDAE